MPNWLKLTWNHQVSTPATWRQGEDVIAVPAVSDEDAKKRFGSFDGKLPCLRHAKQPAPRVAMG